jgi:DNA polymerase-1
VTNQDDLFENEHFIAWLKSEKAQKKVYDAKRTYVALNRYAVAPKGSFLMLY